MFKWIVLSLGLATSAHAAEAPALASPETPAHAGPLDDLKAEQEAKQAEKDAAAEARLALTSASYCEACPRASDALEVEAAEDPRPPRCPWRPC